MENGHHELEILDTTDVAEQSDLPEKPSRISQTIVVLLAVILVFSTLAYGAVETWSFGFLTVLTGLIVILWLVESILKNEFKFSSNLLQIPPGGLILIGLIQILPLRSAEIPTGALTIPAVSSLSLNPYATRVAVVQLIIQLLFFAAALVFLNSSSRIKKSAVGVIVFASAMAFFGIVQWLTNPQGIYGWRPTPQAIPFASFVNQHHFAAFMEMTFGLTLAILLGKATKKDKRPLLALALLLMSIAVILTGSRGGLLSLIGVAGFVAAFSFLKRKEAGKTDRKQSRRANLRRNLAIAGGVLGSILMLFGAVLLLGGDSSLLRGIGVTNQTDFTSGRLHFWSVALKIIQDYPILGTGLDTFATVFPRYDTWNGNFRVEQAHNDYLQILADAGIFGLACVIGFIYLLFKKSLSLITHERSLFRRSVAVGALAGCFGIFIHSFFDFPLRTPSNAFFFLLFAVLATVKTK